MSGIRRGVELAAADLRGKVPLSITFVAAILACFFAMLIATGFHF